MQKTQVGSLVWEDCICHGAIKCTSHNYWSPRTLEPVLCNKRSYCNGAWALKLESSPCLLQLEKVHAKQWRLSTAKDLKIIKKLKLCMLGTLWMEQHFLCWSEDFSAISRKNPSVLLNDYLNRPLIHHTFQSLWVVSIVLVGLYFL